MNLIIETDMIGIFKDKDIKSGLLEYYSDWKSIKGIDLGCGDANLSSYFLKIMPNLFINCVDPWELEIDRPRWNVNSFSRHKLLAQYLKSKSQLEEIGSRYKIIKGFIDEVSYQFIDGTIDFVFFDVNSKKETLNNDILLWTPKVKNDGFVCGLEHAEKIMDTLLNDLCGIMYEDEIIKNFIHLNDKGEWIFGPVNDRIRYFAIEKSKREGDWNESGYFESTHPDARGIRKSESESEN